MPQEPKDAPDQGGISRRNIFGAASLATAGIAATSLWTRQASAAPPPDEKKEEKPKIEPIENFKYDLEKQTHWVGPGGSAKEATVDEFPVSQSLAGVSMRLDPGAIREFSAVVAMNPLDKASAEYNLANAYLSAGDRDKAQETVLASLEAAPDYRPALKLLLQLQDSQKGK